MTDSQPSSHTIELGTGLNYHLLEWGRDQPGLDHTVILVHGFLDLAWGWQQTVEAGLAGRFHIVAPDMRGHGDSDWVGAGGYYHFVDYVADLEDLIARVGRGRVSLVGHSMGGSICAYYAGAFPDRVHRLAMLEGLGPPEQLDPAPHRVRVWVEAWRRLRTSEQRSYPDVAAAAARLRKNDPKLGQELALRLATVGCKVGPDGHLRFKHDPLHTTTSPTPYRVDVASQFWQQIGCPVLLVEGADSIFRFAKDEAARRSQHIRDTRTALIADAGHMMQRHQPERLAQELIRFLDG